MSHWASLFLDLGSSSCTRVVWSGFLLGGARKPLQRCRGCSGVFLDCCPEECRLCPTWRYHRRRNLKGWPILQTRDFWQEGRPRLESNSLRSLLLSACLCDDPCGFVTRTEFSVLADASAFADLIAFTTVSSALFQAPWCYACFLCLGTFRIFELLKLSGRCSNRAVARYFVHLCK